MKAKHFRKIRKKTDWYIVEFSRDLFGSPFQYPTEVLAYNHRHAAQRSQKRTGFRKTIRPRSDDQFAFYRVRRKDAPKHFNSYLYF